MPRVGSLSRIMRGSVISHLASTTFCWLPPESVETASPGAPILICSQSMPRLTAARSLARSTKGPVEMASSDAMVRLSAIDIGSINPSVLRSSGTSAMPTADDFAAAGELIRTSLPSTVMRPVTPRSTPNKASSSDFWPCPSRPPRPTISPPPTLSEMRSRCFSQDRFSSASTGLTCLCTGLAGYWVAMSRPIMSWTISAADLGEQRLGAAALRATIDQAEAPRRRSDRNIVRDGKVRHQRQLLEDAHDASRVGGRRRCEADVIPGKAHAAGIGLDHAGDNLDQRRLAGTVLPQNRMDPAALAGEVDVLKGAHATIALGDAGQCEEGKLRRDGILHGEGSCGRDGLADARP